jgi:transcriptional regulator with XRE-family HTH domain
MNDDLWSRQNKALGSFIRAQRELASLSLRQLSELTDVSNAYLSQIERGLHEPSIRVLKSVAQALGMPPEVLLAQAGLLNLDIGDKPASTRNWWGGGAEAPAATSVVDAIRADPKLTRAEQDALIAVYRSYLSTKP